MAFDDKQVSLFTAEQLDECVRNFPPREDLYVVIACDYRGRWSLRGCRITFEHAKRYAEDLSPYWTHYQIWKIPGVAMKKGLSNGREQD
jgi:hypothetical protein